MKRALRILCLGVALATLLNGVASAQSYNLLKGCDVNVDSQIDDGELLSCILERKRIEFQQYLLTGEIVKLVGQSCLEVEKNVENRGDLSEFTAKLRFLLAETLNDECQDAKDFLQSDPPYSFAQLAEYWNLKPDSGGSGLLVRRSVEDVDLFTPPRSLDKAVGALIGYSKNYLDDSTTLQAEGAFLTSRRFDQGRWLRAFVPSVSFKKIEIEKDGIVDDAGDVDELTGRLAFHFQYRGPGNWGHELRVGTAYLTDFDFDQQIGAVEFDWRPIGLGTCLGHVWGRLNLKCGLGVQVEAGRVFESKDPAAADDDFLRVGPAVSAQISKGPWSLSLRWLYRFEIEGDLDDTDLLRADFNVALDPLSHWSFNAAYEEGELPLSLTPTKTLIVGLGIKY